MKKREKVRTFLRKRKIWFDAGALCNVDPAQVAATSEGDDGNKREEDVGDEGEEDGGLEGEEDGGLEGEENYVNEEN